MKGLVFSFSLTMAMLLCASAAAQERVRIRNVAVVETQTDERSDAANLIKKAEVSEITTEIRRVAVNILPRNRFNIMTTETVHSMGDAVLAECAAENCVITLGTTIGADYIVLGTISTFGQNLTLSVEMYETDYGMLVASAAAVRSADPEELLKKGSAACAAMYKGFLETVPPAMTPAPPTLSAAASSVIAQPPQPEHAATQTKSVGKTSATLVTLRWSSAAIAVSGFAGGLAFHSMADSELGKYNRAGRNTPEERNAKKNMENNKTAGNLLYVLGGISLSGFMITLLF